MINSINTVSSISRSRYGKNMVINGFECIYDEFSILGYDLIQNIIIGTLNDIQRVFYFPEAFKKYIVSSIKKGQRDGSIQNSTEPELLYDVCCHTFIGYILFWCQHNGLTGEYRTMAQILSSVL